MTKLQRLRFLAIVGILFTVLMLSLSPDQHSRHNYAHTEAPVQGTVVFELHALYADAAVDYQTVNDTLQWYMNKMAEISPLTQFDWSLDYCCNEGEMGTWLTESGHENLHFFVKLDFPTVAAKELWLSNFRGADFFRWEASHLDEFVSGGYLEASLPVPGQPEQLIHLRDARWRMLNV